MSGTPWLSMQILLLLLCALPFIANADGVGNSAEAIRSLIRNFSDSNAHFDGLSDDQKLRYARAIRPAGNAVVIRDGPVVLLTRHGDRYEIHPETMPGGPREEALFAGLRNERAPAMNFGQISRPAWIGEEDILGEILFNLRSGRAARGLFDYHSDSDVSLPDLIPIPDPLSESDVEVDDLNRAGVEEQKEGYQENDHDRESDDYDDLPDLVADLEDEDEENSE